MRNTYWGLLDLDGGNSWRRLSSDGSGGGGLGGLDLLNGGSDGGGGGGLRGGHYDEREEMGLVMISNRG